VLSSLLRRVASVRLTGPVSRRLNNTLHALHSLPVEITAI
jgi:4-methoxybenzoate monooxygenase (O-demethylating)